MDNKLYVPMLKGKEGEFAALEALESSVRARVLPLIEVPAVPYDYANERPTKTLEDHVSGIAARLFKCWQSAPLFLDLPWFGEAENFEDERVALEAVLTDCIGIGVEAIPVTSRLRSARYVAAAGDYAKSEETGVCVRLFVKDFEDDIDLPVEVTRLLGGVECQTSDLIIDLQDLGAEASKAVLITRSVLAMIPRRDEWRRIILSAASFPEDLSDVDAATTTSLPRREWSLWKSVQKRTNDLPRQGLIYGDYGIANPIPREIDPRTMRMSASIRYTATNDWLIVKGRNVRQYGFDQYFELCRKLIGLSEYRGEKFSWGDSFIAQCAAGKAGPGNATTWRKVGTNHHLTIVVGELANARPAV